LGGLKLGKVSQGTNKGIPLRKQSFSYWILQRFSTLFYPCQSCQEIILGSSLWEPAKVSELKLMIVPTPSPLESFTWLLVHTQPITIHQNYHWWVPTSLRLSVPGKKSLTVTLRIF
jgi:hypothetical protein